MVNIKCTKHVHFSVCFYLRHMPLIMELSNQYHAILLPPLAPGSTLYLYFPSICSISDNKSLHLEHTPPETGAATASFWPLSARWHTCGCEMLSLSFEPTSCRKEQCRADGSEPLSGRQEMSHVFSTHSLEHEGTFYTKVVGVGDDSDVSCCSRLNN